MPWSCLPLHRRRAFGTKASTHATRLLADDNTQSDRRRRAKSDGVPGGGVVLLRSMRSPRPASSDWIAVACAAARWTIQVADASPSPLFTTRACLRRTGDNAHSALRGQPCAVMSKTYRRHEGGEYPSSVPKRSCSPVYLIFGVTSSANICIWSISSSTRVGGEVEAEQVGDAGLAEGDGLVDDLGRRADQVDVLVRWPCPGP